MTTELIIALSRDCFNFDRLRGLVFLALEKQPSGYANVSDRNTIKQLARTTANRRAEAELSKREKRVGKFNIVSLPRAERARYRENWIVVQNRFVDQPDSAVADAHRLVQEVMQRCGYPLTDFEQSAADISVDHPHVVENFRAATRIADRSKRADASTEELRQALVHYRILFDDLLKSDDPDVSINKSKTVRIRNGKNSGAQPNH